MLICDLIKTTAWQMFYTIFFFLKIQIEFEFI